ncbi:MAG: DUF4062 domain-containing protein [Thermoguttaceae bacterium]
MSGKPIVVFISSTCYDLADVRFELRYYLEERGFIVKMSEDINSAFCVDPTVDSIESCLQNLEQSCVVVCIIDKRYGPCLGGQFSDLSATHTEVRHARKKRKPILYFMRDVAMSEYKQLKTNAVFNPKYIEIGTDNAEKSVSQAAMYKKFVDEIVNLHNAKKSKHSNWADTFKSSYDLKPIVYRRLVDLFPENNYILALKPDRFARSLCTHEF